jgi:hypothetical protein
MTVEAALAAYADKGFAYALAVYLLWRYHTTDREYLRVLQELSSTLKEHIRQKDEALTLLKEAVRK